MIQYVCFVNDTWTNETYTYCHTRYRHDALPISQFCLKEGCEVYTPCYRRGLGTHVRGGATQPLLIRVRLDGSEIGPRRLRSGADMHLPAKHVAARARIRLPAAQVHLPKAVRLWAVRGKVRKRVPELGRASGRERGCRYMLFSG